MVTRFHCQNVNVKTIFRRSRVSCYNIFGDPVYFLWFPAIMHTLLIKMHSSKYLLNIIFLEMCDFSNNFFYDLGDYSAMMGKLASAHIKDDTQWTFLCAFLKTSLLFNGTAHYVSPLSNYFLWLTASTARTAEAILALVCAFLSSLACLCVDETPA